MTKILGHRVPQPKYVTPFHVLDETTVVDGNLNVVAVITPNDDNEYERSFIAHYIARLLNSDNVPDLDSEDF